MSQKDERINSGSPETDLDRLVDGELNETDRHDLLLRLEREPEGWRRCALAFLEAQCWKLELGMAARGPVPLAPEYAKRVSETVTTSRRLAAWRKPLSTALSMGACFLIALALGLGIRGHVPDGGHGPGTSAVTETKEVFPLDASATQRTADKWELVKLVADSPSGLRQTVSIPAVNRDSLDQKMLEQIPDVIPPEVRIALTQAGHQIEEHREIVPVQMNDGRRLMVPVNNVQIHFVRGSL